MPGLYKRLKPESGNDNVTVDSPKKLMQPPTNVKRIVLECYHNVQISYEGVNSSSGCLVIGIPEQQLFSRKNADLDKTLSVFSTWISSNP